MQGIKPYAPQALPAMAPGAPVTIAPLSDEQIAMTLEALGEALRNPQLTPRVFHTLPVTVPAARVNFPINLPAVYDSITVFFPTAAPAGFQIGPEAASIPAAAFRGSITFPGTTNRMIADNPGAAYSLVVFGVIGYPPVEVVGY